MRNCSKAQCGIQFLLFRRNRIISGFPSPLASGLTCSKHLQTSRHFSYRHFRLLSHRGASVANSGFDLLCVEVHKKALLQNVLQYTHWLVKTYQPIVFIYVHATSHYPIHNTTADKTTLLPSSFSFHLLTKLKKKKTVYEILLLSRYRFWQNSTVTAIHRKSI